MVAQKYNKFETQINKHNILRKRRVNSGQLMSAISHDIIDYALNLLLNLSRCLRINWPAVSTTKQLQKY